MRQYVVRYTRIPTNYNPQETMLVEAKNPQDARELVRRALGEDRLDRANYVIEVPYEYSPAPIDGRIIGCDLQSVLQELLVSCKRAVMLCRTFGVPEGEIEHLQAAINKAQLVLQRMEE